MTEEFQLIFKKKARRRPGPPLQSRAPVPSGATLSKVVCLFRRRGGQTLGLSPPSERSVCDPRRREWAAFSPLFGEFWIKACERMTPLLPKHSDLCGFMNSFSVPFLRLMFIMKKQGRRFLPNRAAHGPVFVPSLGLKGNGQPGLFMWPRHVGLLPPLAVPSPEGFQLRGASRDSGRTPCCCVIPIPPTPRLTGPHGTKQTKSSVSCRSGKMAPV